MTAILVCSAVLLVASWLLRRRHRPTPMVESRVSKDALQTCATVARRAHDRLHGRIA